MAALPEVVSNATGFGSFLTSPMAMLVGVGDLGADGGRETEAHRARAERADEAADQGLS